MGIDGQRRKGQSRIVPQAPIRSCAIPVRAPLQRFPHEKKRLEKIEHSSGLQNRQECEKCLLAVWNFSMKWITCSASAFLRKNDAEKGLGVFTLIMLAALTQ